MTAAQQVPAAFYARVSGAEQLKGTSLDTQQDWARGVAQQQGWHLVGEFVDRAISGADDTRPAWNQLRAMIRNGEVGVVLVHDLDRLARDAVDGLSVVRECSRAGVTLLDSKSGGADKASDDLFLQSGVELLVADSWRRNHIRRTIAGQRSRAESGGWPGGEPPFGWHLANKREKGRQRPEPDEAERATLAQMVAWATREGLSCGRITDRLNALGVPTRHSTQPGNPGRWSHAVVRRILTNPALHEGFVWWGAPKGTGPAARSHKTKTGKDGQPLHGKARKLELPNPPLSAAEFRALQRALARHRNAGKTMSPAVSRMLTGRVVGECGKPYTGTSIAGKDYAVYRCTGNRHRGTERAHERCGCSQVHAQKLEARVRAEVAAFLTDPGRLEAMAAKWVAFAETGDPDQDRAEADTARARVAKLDNALSRAERGLLEADTAEDEQRQKALVAELRKERADLRERLAAWDAFQADAAARAAQVQSLVALRERGIARLATMSDDDWRELLALLDVHVRIGGIADSEPAELRIEGRIDPRLFDDGRDDERPADRPGKGGPTTGAPQPRTRKDSITPTSPLHAVPRGSSAKVSVSTPQHGPDRGDGVLGRGGAGVVGEQSGGSVPRQRRERDAPRTRRARQGGSGTCIETDAGGGDHGDSFGGCGW